MSSEWWNEAWFGQLFASESDSLAPEAVEEDTTQEVTQERSETLHQDAVNEDKQSFQFGTLLPEVLTSLLSPRVLGGKEEGSYEDQFASASSPSREKELEDLVDEARLSSDLMPSSAAPVSTSSASAPNGHPPTITGKVEIDREHTERLLLEGFSSALERVDTPPSAIPNSTKVDSTLAPARPERLKRASGARKGDGAMRPPAAQAASSKRLLPAILNAAAKSKAAAASPRQEGGELPKLAADQGTGAAPGSALTVRLPASGTARPAVQSAAAASASPRPNAAAKQAANAALEPAASGVKSGGSVAAAVRKVVVEADRPMAADVEQKLLGSDEGAPLQAPRGGTHHTSAARPEDAPRGNAPSPSFSVVRGATASPSDSDPTAALGAPTSAVGGVGLSEPDHVAVPCAGAAAVEAVGLSAHNPAAVPGAGAAAVEAVGLSARNPAAVPGAQAGAAVKTGGASEASEGAHVHQGAKGFEELFASHSAPSWIAQWKSSLRPDGVDPARRWTFGGPAPLTSPEPHRLRGGTAGTRVSPLLKIPAVVRGSEGAPSWTHPHRSPSNSCSKVTLVPPSPRPGQRSKDGRTEAVEQAGMRSSPSPGTRRQQSMKNATAGGGGGGLAAPRMSPSARGYTQKPASDVPDAKGGSMTSTALMRMDWAELGFPPVDCGAPGDEPAESSVPWRQADSSLASCVFGMELSDWLFASTATRVPARAEVAQEAQCIPLAAPHRGSESAMPAEEEHAAAGSPHDVPDDDPLAAFLGADDGDDFWLSAGGQDGLSAGVQDSLSAGGQDSPAAAAHSAEVRDTFDTTAPVQPEGDAVAEAASPAEGAGAGWRRHHTMTPGDGGTFEEAFAALFGAEPPSAEEGGPACGGVSRGTVDLEETVHGDDGGSSSSLDLTVYGGDGRSLAASTETVRGLDCGSSDGLGETARGDDSGSSGDWMMRVHIGDGGSSADLEEAASAGDISSSDHPDRGVTAHDGDGGGLGDSGRARAVAAVTARAIPTGGEPCANSRRQFPISVMPAIMIMLMPAVMIMLMPAARNPTIHRSSKEQGPAGGRGRGENRGLGEGSRDVGDPHQAAPEATMFLNPTFDIQPLDSPEIARPDAEIAFDGGTVAKAVFSAAEFNDLSASSRKEAPAGEPATAQAGSQAEDAAPSSASGTLRLRRMSEAFRDRPQADTWQASQAAQVEPPNGEADTWQAAQVEPPNGEAVYGLSLGDWLGVPDALQAKAVHVDVLQAKAVHVDAGKGGTRGALEAPSSSSAAVLVAGTAEHLRGGDLVSACDAEAREDTDGSLSEGRKLRSVRDNL
eukprot:gene10342-12230_t